MPDLVHQGSGYRDSVFGMMFQCHVEGLVQFLRLVAVHLTLTVAAGSLYHHKTGTET